MTSFFVHGAMAWATLGLVSIPILIHLINRRRFRRLDWAAMEFLLAAMRRNRRRIRVEQLILLLLRILLMALVGFLLARPILSGGGLEWLAGTFRSEDKVLLLDDSFSTSRRESGRTVFQRELESLQTQIRRLAERGTRDRLTVARASRYRSPLARGVFVDRERALALSQSLLKLTPTDLRMPLSDALLSLEASLAEGAEGVVRPKSVWVFTDLRAVDWTDGRGGPDEALHQAMLRLVKDEDDPGRITIVDLGSDDTASVGITDVFVEGGSPVQDIPADIRVEVRNFGSTAARNLGFRLRYGPAPALASEDLSGSTAIGPPLVELAPGASAAVTISCTFRSAGHYGAVVELTGAGDPLSGDDSFALAVEVVSGTDVLLVSGEPSSEPFEGETDFLAEALAPSGEVSSGLRPAVVVEENFPRTEIEKFAAIFACNLTSFPVQMAQLLAKYVEEGGTLVTFLGDQVDAALYNRDLSAGGLIPGRLGELKVNQESPLGLVPALDHPYFRLLRDVGDLLSMVHFYKHFTLEPLAAATVLARFSNAEASPAIVERPLGKGRAIVVASTADMEWNDWARNPTYLMTLQELVQTVVRSRSARSSHLAGAPVEVPVDIASYSREGRLRSPGYPSQPERTIGAAPGAASQPAFRFLLDDTSRAGLYALCLKPKSGEEEWRHVAVRRDPAESNLERISAAKLRELYPDVDLSVVKDSSGFSDVGRGRFEISDFLLWVFVGLLFVEAFLARWFAHHQPQESRQGTGGSA